jgi:hypothetical protein
MFERTMNQKLKLMDQRAMIEKLSQNENQDYDQNIPRRRIVEDEFAFKQNIAMPSKQPPEFKDYLLQLQGHLISQLSSANSNIIPRIT